MTKKAVTPEQTSGSGFDFEDKVTAYFLANLLADKYPLEPEIGLLRVCKELRHRQHIR